MHREYSRFVALGAAWVVFTVCCVLPLGGMLFIAAGSESLQSVVLDLAADRQQMLLIRTLMLGAGVVGFALAVGVPLGVVLGRCDQRRAQWPRALLVLPLVLPSYVLALAWMVLFGASGSEWVYSLPAAIVVLGFSLYPMVMLATEASLRQVSARLEEAARLVASVRRTWFKVTFPLILPAVGASALLAFVLAISDFAVPALLRVRVYTTEVFTAFAALYDFGRATLIALPLIVIASAAAAIALKLLRHPVVGRTERGPIGATWPRVMQQIAAIALAAIALLVLAFPIGALIGEAVSSRASLSDATSADAIRNSFVWAGAGASLVVVVGSLLAYWRTRAGTRAGHAADSLFVALFAVPATVLGVGIIALWNRPGLAGTIYRSDAIVLLAYLGRFVPVAALLCAGFFRMVPLAAEEAATIAGASWMRSLLQVVLPMARRGLAAVWLIMFILILGDVGVTILVAPPGESTIPIRAYTLIANSPTPDVARLGLLQIAASVLPVAAIVVLWRRRQEPLG